MQFKPQVPGVEVLGNSLQFVVSGFRIVPSVAYGYLTKFGLLAPRPGAKPELSVDAWYSFDRWMKVFEAIYREVGPSVTFEIGHELGAKIALPPPVTGHVSLLRFLDAGYHMNHRLHGRVMFDINTGVMLDGIGHYKIDVDPAAKRAVAICDNPYPCEFDLGLMTAVANRFEKARTVHDPKAPCRAKGAESCTYVSTW